MGIAAHFLHTAVLQRDMGVANAYGEKVSDWHDLAPMPCRLVEHEDRVLNDQHTEVVSIKRYTLILDGNAEADEYMRVGKVVLEDRSEVGPFLITNVLQQRTRAAFTKTCNLQRAT